MSNDKKEDVKIDKMYGRLCKMTKEEVISEFKVKKEGLTDSEVTQKIRTYGYNEVSRNKKKKMVQLFMEKFYNTI